MAGSSVKHPLGKGWKFPFQFTDIGGVKQSASSNDDEILDLLRGSIHQIIFTNIGERVVRRSFGSKLKQLIFEINDDSLDVLLNSTVFEAISSQEPRVDLTATSIDRSRINEGISAIMASVRVKRTNTKGNLVLPFVNQGPQGQQVGP